MENEILNAGEQEEVTATSEEATTDEKPVESVEETEPTEEKKFTQEQVNDFVRKRLEKENNKIYKRYGVENKTALDELIGQAQSYQVMKERYADMKTQNANFLEENAFLKNNINPDKYDDVRAYFKGKGIEFSNDNLVNELATHNEWVKSNPVTTIQSLGATGQTATPQQSESEIAAKLFGLKNFK